MISYLSLDEKIIVIDAYRSSRVLNVVIGLINGDVILWRSGIDSASSINSIDTIDTRTLLTHNDEVTDIAFSKDGTKVASCGLDRYLYVCDVDTGMRLFEREHSNCLTCLHWCHLSDMLYLGDDTGDIYVWDMISGEKNSSKHTFDGPITSVTTTNMDNKKCYVVVAGMERNEFSVKAWHNE